MHRYDGTSKQRTKSCDGCSHLITLTYHAGWGPIIDEVCNQGVAFKRLYQIEDPKKCEFADKPCKAPDRTLEEIKYVLIRRATLWMKRRIRQDALYTADGTRRQLELRLNDRKEL